MSVDMPPELAWVARLAVGQAWPRGNEDHLHALGQAWQDAAQELKGISGQIGATGNGVLESVGGQVADEFHSFVTQLESSLPEMAESANQLGKLGKHTAVQVEYSKYMILGQLILLAAQIAEWIFFAPEVIPVAITAARVAVKMILRRLLISVATGVAMNVGLDVAVQTIQFLKGDRTEWSTDNTVSAVVSGAIGGAVGGLFFGAGSVLAPRFAHSLLGKGILGAATGIGTAGIMYGIYHSGQDEFGSSISAGALGALGGGGKRRFGGKGDTVKIDPVHVNVPGALTFDTATLPATVSAEKPELSGTNTFKETAGGTTTAVTNGTAHTTGAAPTAQPGTTARTATATGTNTAEAGHGASRTGNSAVVHETTHGVSSPGTAEHETGLPGFTTTVTTASHTAASTTGAPPTTGAPSTTRAGTAATAPTPTRATTGGGTTGTGPTTTSVSRPTTTAGPGATSTTATSTPTATGGARPSTVSTGPGSTATGHGSTAATGPAPSPVRAESTGVTETGAGVTETGTEAGITPHETAAAPEQGTAATSATSATAATAATAHGTGAAPERGTGTVVGRPRDEAAAPVPDPPPPPGGHPAGSAPPPRMRLDRTPRIVVRSAFEARRFTYRDEGVTDLTVKVAFRDGGRGHDTDAVWAKVTAGVETYLNAPGYRLPGPDHTPGAGDRLHVTVVRAKPGEEAHLTVDLVDGDGVMDQRRWRADAEPVEFAHELTHQVLNLRDEYRDDAVPHRPQVEGSLLGDFHTDSPDGLSRGGLRERHLQLVAAVVGDLHREEPGLGHDAEWEQTRLAATPHKRSHTWVDPVSDPTRYEPLDGSGQKASAVTEPRMHATLLARRRQMAADSDEEPDADAEWDDTPSAPATGHATTAAPGPARYMGPAPTPVTAQHDHGTGAGEQNPDRPRTPESGDRTGHTAAADHRTAVAEAAVPPPVSLPDGPFTAHTLWGEETPVQFGLVVTKGRYGRSDELTPVAYSDGPETEALPVEDPDGLYNLWVGRSLAYQGMAEAAAHRLRLITERAQGTVDTKQAGDPERRRAERLLRTNASMERDGWRPEYRSEFLRMQMLMGDSDFLKDLPAELVVNNRWRSGTESGAHPETPWALVSPDDPDGPIGGSLHGPDGVSERFHAWLDQNGGQSEHLANWGADQSAGSTTGLALRFKMMTSHFRPARHEDGFHLPRLEVSDLHDDTFPPMGHDDAKLVTRFDPVYMRSMVAQHVFTHEILTRVKMPNVDAGRGVVQLLRLDKRDLVKEANDGTTPGIGDRIRMRRGPADSFSLLTQYKDATQEDHTLGPFWVTAQEIPLHQVFGTYLQSRPGDPEHTLFLYHSENEFLALSDGVESVFHGTDTPPVLSVVRESSATHPDEYAPRAPVSSGDNRRTASSDDASAHQASSAAQEQPDTDVPAESSSSRVVTPAVARSRYGIPEKNFDKFNRLARARELVIDVRPTNPTSVHWLEAGRLPKPKDIKAKSINDLDIQLGAKPEKRGLVGYFDPVLPERGDLDEPTWNRIEARYAQRAEEFKALAPVMARLRSEDRFRVEDGVVLGRDDQGEWREITGDHDVFDISTPGGTRLRGERYDEVVGAMLTNDMGVMHGAHMAWEPATPFSKGIFSKIVDSHREGGEPLLRFGPGHANPELVHVPSEFLTKDGQPAPPPASTGHAQHHSPPEPEPQPKPRDPEPQPKPQPKPKPQPEPKSAGGSLRSSSASEDVVVGGRPEEPRVSPVTAPAAAVGEVVGGAEPEPVTPAPEGHPAPPRPPGDAPHLAEAPAGDHPAPAPEPPEAAEPPAPADSPARLGGRHLRSLAGIRITDAPGPEALRARVLATLPEAHRADRRLVQRLDTEFDPATFRTRHEQMVNGGWRFQIRVAGAPHEVLLTATPGNWARRAEQATAEERDGKSYDRSAEAKRAADPKKTSLTTTEAGLDLAPNLIVQAGGRGDRMGLITPSVKAGGATHATDTSVRTGAETGTKTSLTGPTDTYVSRFHYEATVTGPDGHPLPRAAGDPVTGDVTAEITRTAPDPADDRAAEWNGWESDRPGPPEGRPLDVTGLSALHEDVFRRLPREGRPDGVAHRAILEFLSPKNVVDGFEHAAGWGLTSERLDLTDGGHAWLRLTLEPETSVREGTVAGKSTVTSKETGEHATGRSDTSTWGAGLNGGGAQRLWKSGTTKESSWLSVTGGYTYAASHAHQEKGKQTFSLERSLERKDAGDLVRTGARFRLEVLRERLSPGPDGLHAVRAEPEPAPARGEPGHDEENPAAVRTGEVIRVSDRPAAPPTGSDAGAGAVPRDLRAPLVAQRTAFVDVPGSRELERHITERLRELAPGILPPPDGTAGRVTPQAMENQRLLRERVSRSGLRADGEDLLDGTFRITLDASHLPGLPGRTYEVVVRADTGAGRHDGAAAGTAKTTVARGHAADKGVTRGSKHTLGVSGFLRRALNPPDTVRAFGNAGVDGSYGPSRATVASSETQAKRTFQYKGPGDAFSYPVTYRVLVAPHREGAPPSRLPAARAADGHGPDGVREVALAADDRLRVEVRRAEHSPSAPAYLPNPRLPLAHAVLRVTDEAGFQRQARSALEAAYRSREPDVEPPRIPDDLDEAVAALAGRAQLPGLVSASHTGWANTLDRHVGDGRAPDTVGLSVRTRLIGLRYQETLSGDATLDLELKASGATALADQSSWSVKGSLGPDFGLFPETATGALTTTFQVRGGGKAKVGGQWDDVDTLKQQTGTTRKVSHTGTWHVYRATAEVRVAGRLTEASGASHVGRPVPYFHDIDVLLSDEDVVRMGSAVATAPPRELRATLLDQGISGGALVHLPDTDPVLHEIDRQLRGPDAGAHPVAALPFADTFSADALAARYDELVGPGVLDRHVEMTRAGHVVTEVLVRGISDGWHDDGSRSDRPLTRDVTAAHTVKGKAGAKGTFGVEGNLRGSVDPPVPHVNALSAAPAGALEGGRGSSAESGVSTTVGHKTSGFGDTNARFTTDLRYEVTVTRRTEIGRFMRLPAEPDPVGPHQATAWVPLSLTEDAAAAPHPGAPAAPDDPAHPAAQPFGIELGRVRDPAQWAAWQNTLHEAHDLVGFDNSKALHDTAVQLQAAPRPWGDGVLGQTGAYYSWALAKGADAAGWAAHTVLPSSVTEHASRFLATFTADSRLGAGHDLSQEQRLTLEEQFAIRQMFSGQSLPALFHELASPALPYRVPGTSLAVSMEAIGPAEELSRRAAADDELSVAVKDESATAATHSYNWSVSPADLAVLTQDPVLGIPLNTTRLTRDRTFDSDRPVTRTPGAPSRPTPAPAPSLPHDLPPTEPGKAARSGATALMRQPVRITLHPHDDTGPHGTPRSVTGHVFHWTTPAEPAPPAPAHTHDITFTAEETPTLDPAQTAHLDALAGDVARHAGPPATRPTVLITGHASVTVSGQPHFGRSIQLAAARAAHVRALFAARLDTHLRALGSPLTSDAFTITTAPQEAPQHTTTITITRP
ncbi:hypothetical protein [Streptomyces sp. NPDC021562]|uniref:WXG100-like domain-containing protein n=1 Tax=Streptomyces sp. NPDC021562 TaxID=3155121 RepID=UPI0033DC3B47